jgi:hypothetical protein
MPTRDRVFAALALLAGVAFPLLMAAEPGSAMPLFTRATGEPCATCHAGFSRLRPYAVGFLARGYRDLGPLGFEANRAKMPVSVVGDLGQELKSAHGQPRELHVVAAGPLQGPGGQPLSAFAEAVVDSGRVRADRAWLQLDGIGRWHAAAFRVGGFDAEMPFLSTRRRTTLAPYLAPVTIEAQGAEFRVAGANSEIGGGLIESHREASAFGRLQDSFFWVRQGWRANDLAARVWFDRQDSDVPGLSWLQHLQYQVAARLSVGPCEIVPAYMQDRFDDQPVIKNHDKRHFFLMEAFAPLDPTRRWSATARYERMYHTQTMVTPEEDLGLGVFDLAYHVSPNAQVAVEWNDRSENFRKPDTHGADAWFRFAF